MRYSTQIRTVAARVLAPAVWLTGALATALTLLKPEPLYALATLGVVITITIILLRPTLGWRAVPIVGSLTALMFPVLMLVAFDDVRRPLGDSGAIGLS